MINEGEYQMEVLIWKEDKKIKMCQYKLKVLGKPLNEPKCMKPVNIDNGLLLCDATPNDDFYPMGSVCQYFCNPGYIPSQRPSNGGLMVCKGDKWTPSYNLKCLATQCLHPEAPWNGFLRCNHIGNIDTTDKSYQKYQTGTICQYECEVGYVIPTSQMGKAVIECIAPAWNNSDVPDCKQVIPPVPYCTNQTVATGSIAQVKKPYFMSSTNKPLDAKCTIMEELNVGEYLNYCEATDPELRVSTSCTYAVIVKAGVCPPPMIPNHGTIICKAPKGNRYIPFTMCEYICDQGYVIPVSQQQYRFLHCSSVLMWNNTVVPQCKKLIVPISRECRNQTIVAKGEMARIKKPKFVSSSGNLLKVKCNVEGEVGVGWYKNYCEAKDLDLGLIANCFYFINVKANMCQRPKEIMHGNIKCNEKNIGHYPPSTICEYECDEGYTIPTRLIKRKFQLCLPHLKWNNTLLPRCREIILPHHHQNDCQDQILIAKNGLARLKKPRFFSSRNKLLKSKCTLRRNLKVGYYENYCESTDPELRVTSFCNYSVIVKAPECHPPRQIDHGDVRCHGPTPGAFPPDTVCEYACHDGFAIPTSQLSRRFQMCLKKSAWNKTGIPQCQKIILPQPFPGDCQNQTFTTKLGTATVNKPQFTTSSKEPAVVSCTVEGDVGIGHYINYCEATDPELRITVNCTYSINVSVLECQEPPKIPNGDVNCFSSLPGQYPPSTICTYSCENGFVIPTSQMNLSSRECVSKLEWNTTSVPTCQKIIPPLPDPGHCQNQTLTPKEKTAIVEKPHFMTFNNESAKVNCTVEGEAEIGLYLNYCEATDTELRITVSCIYSIDIKVLECQEPPLIANGEVECLSDIPGKYPLSTVCTYMCKSGFVIPLNQMNISSRQCEPELKWNTSLVPSCQEAAIPKPAEKSCVDQTIEIEKLTTLFLESPVFITGHDQSVEVTCSPSNISEYGLYPISCMAFDTHLGTSATCEYNLTVKDVDLKCEPLIAPTNGYIICNAENKKSHCEVKCNDGYNFHSSYPLLHDGNVECDSSEKQWDFQKEYDIETLPDCLGELPRTSLQVSVKFNSKADHCLHFVNSDHLRNIAKEMFLTKHENFCKNISCADFVLTCTKGRDSDEDILEAAWILKIDFIPEDYDYSDEVPEAELLIDRALLNTQKTVTSDENFQKDLGGLGIELLQDSFQQSRFTLVCEKKGYEVDPLTNKCIECPTGSYETGGKCLRCPKDQYQDQTGQIECKPCPTHNEEAFLPLLRYCKKEVVGLDPN